MQKKKVALALGSGGARGLTQIGVIEELLKRGYEIVSIAGTSIGSLIGGLQATGHLGAYRDWIIDLDQSEVFDLVDFTLSAQGFVKGDKVFNEMRKFIPSVDIETLEIPFVAVAADLISREEVILKSGDLFEAVRASVAVPSVLTPVERGDQLLVDGGVVNPLPISALPESEADLVMAINLNAPGEYMPVPHESTKRDLERKMWDDYIRDRFSLSFSQFFFSKAKKKKKPNYFEIVNGSFDLMQDKLTDVILENNTPDLLINIPRECASTFEFYKGEELIEYGRQVTRKELNALEKKKES